MLKKWVLAASLVGATALAGAGITFALFTDATQPVTKDFVAGRLALEGNRVDETLEGPIFYISNGGDGMSTGGLPGARETGLWAPGDSHAREWQIENIGSLDARLISISATQTEVILGENGENLADALDVEVKDVHGTLLASGKLADFYGHGQEFAPYILLERTDNLDLYITVELPKATGNEYQGTKVVVTFTAYAEQDKNR